MNLHSIPLSSVHWQEPAFPTAALFFFLVLKLPGSTMCLFGRSARFKRTEKKCIFIHHSSCPYQDLYIYATCRFNIATNKPLKNAKINLICKTYFILTMSESDVNRPPGNFSLKLNAGLTLENLIFPSRLQSLGSNFNVSQPR